MNIGKPNFAGNNHTKGCRPPISHRYKTEWQKNQFPKRLWHSSTALIIVIGDSIVPALRRCQHVWKNYFKYTINLSISSDHVEGILWRAQNISLPYTK